MFSKRVTAAIDIGAHTFKYVEVESDTARVRRAWSAPLCPEREEAGLALHGDALRARLRDVVRRLQREVTVPPRVVTALQGEGTWLQYLDLPPLSAAEREQAARAAACKALPFSLSQMVMSTVSVPPLRENRGGMLVVAALRDPAATLSATFEACGVGVQRLEMVPLALAREFGRNHPERADRFIALVNVGFSSTHLAVLRAGLPYFARELPTGGRHFLHALQKAQRFTWGETERHFLADDLGDLMATCEPPLRTWLHEVNRSLIHFRERVALISGVEEIWLSGGFGHWPPLRERLAQAFELPVEVDGWGSVTWKSRIPAEGAGLWKAAVGMALET